jgi:hypothetical protein
MFRSPRQARALLAPPLQVHDNPQAVLACNYDWLKPLCHSGWATEKIISHPALDCCNPACANIARTDKHITALTVGFAGFGPKPPARSPPRPIRRRLAQTR